MITQSHLTQRRYPPIYISPTTTLLVFDAIPFFRRVFTLSSSSFDLHVQPFAGLGALALAHSLFVRVCWHTTHIGIDACELGAFVLIFLVTSYGREPEFCQRVCRNLPSLELGDLFLASSWKAMQT